MKHLKAFESTYWEQNYRIGDYVLLDLERIEEEGYNKDVIKFIDNMGKIVKYEEDQSYEYTVEFYTNTTIPVREEEILRKLTPEEITEYKMKKDANKYNI